VTRPTSFFQRGLQFFNGCLFLPNSVDGTGSGAGLGAAWTTDTAAVGIAVTHATVGTAFDTQFKRTIYTNAAGTANQELGPRQSHAGDYQFWFGNAASLGGWYMSTIFRIETWNSDSGRLFAGMTASTNPVCISDTIPNNTIGLWHDSTDGQDVMNLVIKGTGAVDKTLSVTTHALNPGILAAGVTLLWEMWAFPFGISVINTNFRLSQFDATNKRVNRVKWNAQGGGPTTTTMCAPQVQMSNGADTTVSHYSISVANIYCAPYSQTLDGTG